MLTSMTLAVPRRTNIPKSYGEMTKRHPMRTPFILLVGQLFSDGGSTCLWIVLYAYEHMHIILYAHTSFSRTKFTSDSHWYTVIRNMHTYKPIRACPPKKPVIVNLALFSDKYVQNSYHPLGLIDIIIAFGSIRTLSGALYLISNQRFPKI